MKIKGTAPPASSANRGRHGTWSRGSTQMKNTLARRRAFTLIELMTVVVIVGVLAAVSLVGYRRIITASKITEAVNMVQTIRIAQEEFRGETGHFADIGIDARCPVLSSQPPLPHKSAWNANCVGSAGRPWALLPVHPDGPVMYSYGTSAGVAGEAVAKRGRRHAERKGDCLGHADQRLVHRAGTWRYGRKRC